MPIASRFIEENHEFKLESHKAQHSEPPNLGAPSQDLMTYWGLFDQSQLICSRLMCFPGYKFETLSLLPNQWDHTTREYIEGREKLVVRNYAQYCSLVRTGFGNSKIIIGGEVDGRKLYTTSYVPLTKRWILRSLGRQTREQRRTSQLGRIEDFGGNREWQRHA